jgi:RNA polymerase sigma-70 factor (sigma-E family)
MGRLDEDPVRYVRRVLVTTSVSWWRRRWRGEVATGVLPELVGTVDDRSEAQDLWTALRHLSVRQRTVVVLRYYEDLSEAETADLLGCSVGTVKSQCSRALARLRVDTELAPVPEERSGT